MMFGDTKVLLLLGDILYGMEQLEFFTIPSPCIGVCESNPKGFCKGCFRSRQERLYWLHFTDAQKRQVLSLCRLRKRKFEQLMWQTQGKLAEDIDIPEQVDFDFE